MVHDPNKKAQNLGNMETSMGIQNKSCEEFQACFANNYLVSRCHKQNLAWVVLLFPHSDIWSGG